MGGEGVALQLFTLHIFVVLFLVPLSPFLYTAAEASFDIKRLVGSRTIGHVLFISLE
jgi:hypothetical protein